MKIKDFLEVYEGVKSIKVKIDYECDFEIEMITINNYNEMKEQLGFLTIKSIDFDYSDEDGDCGLYIETKPHLFLSESEYNEIMSDDFTRELYKDYTLEIDRDI